MGSFTGEISSSMLLDAGVKYVILGHGERRSTGETDENINTKIISILKTKIRIDNNVRTTQNDSKTIFEGKGIRCTEDYKNLVEEIING